MVTKPEAQNPKLKTQSSKWRAIILVLSFELWILSFRVVSAADPTGEAARRYQQGLAYERLSRIEEAYTELQLAANLEPSDAKIQLALGLVASRAGNLDVAQRALEQSIALTGNSVASYHHLALLFEKKGNKARALECWQRFHQLNQDPTLREVAQKHIRYLEQ